MEEKNLEKELRKLKLACPSPDTDRAVLRHAEKSLAGFRQDLDTGSKTGQGAFGMSKLIYTDENNKEKVFTLRESISIGRSRQMNDLAIHEIMASRRHCQIEKSPDGYKIIDLGSSNGTRVNGNLVTTAMLKDGDVIRAGSLNIENADDP